MIEQMMIEIAHLEKAIIDITPKMNAAMKTFHLLRDKRTNMMTRHRELQKEVKLLRGDVIKLSSSASVTRKPKEQTSQAPISTIVSKMSDDEKKQLKELLLNLL